MRLYHNLKRACMLWNDNHIDDGLGWVCMIYYQQPTSDRGPQLHRL
jgi:hypothetical protein